jgi:8-oxo-dGTP pyrophosphatase MutT (NUDIX family)
MSAHDQINRARLERLRRGLEPAHHLTHDRDANRRQAAVLMPIFELEDDLHLVYIRRSDRVESHPGQVAFPGGRVDPSDESLLATALREAWEEVGIESSAVEVLGTFEGATTRAGDIFVTPFVGVIPAGHRLIADPREVATIFFTPVRVLEDPRQHGTYRFRRDAGRVTEHPAIFYNDQVIWGLTLRFTQEMLRRMQGTTPG